MATRDENIIYELIFVEEFYKYAYPNSSPEHKQYYMETVKRGEIQTSTFMENAVANAGGLVRDSRWAMDLNDGSEVKIAVSSARNNNLSKGSWMNTYEISNVNTKTGPLRIIGYNKVLIKFEYYFIPNCEISHLKSKLTLPIETFSGYYSSKGMAPIFTGIRTGTSKWHDFLIDDFVKMCQMR
jgi:hypothetical protein